MSIQGVGVGFECCNGQIQIAAVILDLDGTILDTEKATANVLKDYLAKHGKVCDYEKEENRLGAMFKESAMGIINDYGLECTIEEYTMEIIPLYHEKWPQAKALPGADRLIRHLHKHGVPLALASNSQRKHVEMKISYHEGWMESFSAIVGGDEVKSGKPSPYIFLEAANRLGVDPLSCLVIEDSLVGVTAAKAAGMKVVAVPSLLNQFDRYSADSVHHSLLEFQPELWGLPAFEDRVQDALPIEPIYTEVLVSKGGCWEGSMILDVIKDNDTSMNLPDQAWGVHFGWARHNKHGIFKVMVGIHWDLHLGIAKRTIELCLVEIEGNIHGEQLQLLIVGYIHGEVFKHYINSFLLFSFLKEGMHNHIIKNCQTHYNRIYSDLVKLICHGQTRQGQTFLSRTDLTS